jgi:hypothetical protein
MSTPIPDFDEFVRSRPPAGGMPGARAPRRASSPAAPPAGVDPRLDSFLENDVLPEAARRSGFTYKLGEGVRTPAQQAEKVARGVSWTLNSKHLTGRGRDVLAFDSSGNYITDGAHPAYRTLGEVAQEYAPKAPAPIRWGVVRGGRQVDPGHFELEDDDGAQVTSVPDFDEFLQSRVNAQPVPDFEEFKRQQAAVSSDPLAGRDAQPGEEVERVNVTLRRKPDPFTPEGRARRDARLRAESEGGALYRVRVDDDLDGAVAKIAEDTQVPADYVKTWLSTGGRHLGLWDEQGRPLESSPTGYAAIPTELVGRMKADYAASRPNVVRAADWLTDETRTPGEKALDVAVPAVQAGARAGDILTRPLQAFDAGFWSKVRGADNLTAVRTAYEQFFGDDPELGKNVVAELLRHSDRLRRVNPRLPALLGELANIVVEPSNLIPVGAVAKGAKVFRGAEGAAELGRVGRLVESAGGAAREAGLLDRGLIEARPLGLLEGSQNGFGKAAADAAAPGAGKMIDEAGLLRKAREHNLPLEEVRAEALRQGYSISPAAQAPEASAKSAVGRDIAPAQGATSPSFPVDDALHRRSPYYKMDPQEVLSAAIEGQRARLTELRRLEAAAARGIDPKTGAELSSRRLRNLQTQVEGLRTDVANGPALVRESFGEEAARAFEQHASEGLPTEFTFDPRAGERGAMNVSEIAAGVRRAASKETLLDLANVPRTLKASADLSAPLRQGAVFTLTEPRAAGRAMRAQLRAFAGEGNFEQIARDIAFHPDADLARRSGLYFATQEAAQPLARGVARPLGAREEAFMSRIAGSLPLVRHSERAYTTYLDKLRMEVFSKYAGEIRSAAAAAGRALDPKEFRDIADFVNKATGRGDIGDWGKTGAPALNATFFAPRYVASRFQVLNPLTYARISPVARRIAVRKMVQFAGTVGATMLLLKGAGADVNFTDPADPDWLKVKFGNSRYDLTGGARTEMRFLYRFGNSVRQGLTGRKVERGQDAGTILQRYVRSKLAPLPGTAADAAMGKTYTGQPFSPKRAAVDLVTPLMLTDLYDAYQVDGATGALKTLPGAIGIGVQTYASKRPSDGQ